jgi:hypothetical protein
MRRVYPPLRRALEEGGKRFVYCEGQDAFIDGEIHTTALRDTKKLNKVSTLRSASNLDYKQTRGRRNKQRAT